MENPTKITVKREIYVIGKYCSVCCEFWDNEGGHSTCSLFPESLKEVRDKASNIFSERSKSCMANEIKAK